MTNEYLTFSNQLYWGCLVDYETNRSDCSGRCPDYCRCTTVSPTFNSIYYDEIYYHITNKRTISNIKEYCLDRGIRKSVQEDDIDLYSVSGYYGEEVRVSGERASLKLKSLINFLNTHTDTECVEHVLILEYGHILSDIKNKKWTIDTVDIQRIHVQNYKHVSENIVKQYCDTSYNKKDNVVLCVKESGEYRLIDGCHRFTATMQDGKNSIKVIYCE